MHVRDLVEVLLALPQDARVIIPGRAVDFVEVSGAVQDEAIFTDGEWQLSDDRDPGGERLVRLLGADDQV